MYFLLLLSLLSLSFGFVEIGNLDVPRVADEYVITYHENTTSEETQNHWDLMATYGIEFIHRYDVGIHHGFAAKILDQSVLEKLQNDPIVMAIDVNAIMHTNQKTCTGHTPVALSWGLPRISYSGPIEDGLPDHYNYDTDKFSGNGVKVYIIDTGILTTHQDFAPNRAEWGIAIAPGGNVDGNGHGTHCAGTAVGTQFGVAKRAHVVAVKVLGAGGSGTIADVVAGIDWVTANGVPGKAVGSMSLGATGNFPTITTAVNNAVLKGIPIVVAAGNSNGDACNYSPAGVASAICVGASEIAGAEGGEFDSRSSFSNWGRCLTLFAPGRDINSAWIGSNTATRVISGTSMACPHVAGQVACILSSDPSPISPQVVKDQLVATSLKDLIANAGTASPNLLLHNECHR